LNTMQNIVKGEMGNMRDHRPDVPDEFAELLEKALHIEPNERFNTADEMRRALVHVASVHELNVDVDCIASFVGDVIGPEHITLQHDINQMRSSIRSMPPIGRRGVGRRFKNAFALSGWVGTLFGFTTSALLVFALLFVLINPLRLMIPSHPLNEPPDYTGEPLRIQLAPTIDPQILLKDLEPIRRYLAHSLKQPVELSVGSSYEEAAQSIADGKADLALLPPFIYTQTHDKNPEVRVIATKVDEGSTGSDSYLLVRGDDSAKGASDLIGRTICHSDENSTTSYVLPRAYLRKQGVDPDTQMQAHISGNHLQVVREILNKTCDVGAIYTGAYLAAESAGIDVSATRMLGVAGRAPHDALVVGPNTSAETEKAVLEALLKLDVKRDLGIERLGTVERISGFSAADNTLYDGLREAIGLARKNDQ